MEALLEETVLDLLTERNAGQIRDFMAAWGEHRNTSWVNAHREAHARAASGGHLPQIRGQLRYHLGELALAESARSTKVGVLPFVTTPPGGAFMIARLGRFAVISLTVRKNRLSPRRSVTRKLLSQPNAELEPQHRLALDGRASARGATELAYLGCVVAVPCKADPTVPSELVFAVPTAALNDWIVWIPLHRMHALLQERADAGRASQRTPGATIPDHVFPKFRLPKRDDTADDDGGAA